MSDRQSPVARMTTRIYMNTPYGPSVPCSHRHLVLTPLRRALSVGLLCPSLMFAASPRSLAIPVGLARTSADTALSSDTLSVQLARITTDTGAFAPGHRDWTRYETLDLCLAAARDARQTLRRSLATQALRQHSIEYDTVGNGGTALVARACGARFTLRTVAPSDLSRLFTLAIAEQNDSLVQAVLPVLIASQGGEWVQAMTELLAYGWRTEAETLVARVDARGPSVRWPRFVLHLCLWNGSCTVRRSGETLIGSVGALDSLAHVLKLGREVLAGAGAFEGNIEVYKALMNWAAYNAPDSIPVFAVRARHDFDRFKDVRGRNDLENVAFRQYDSASVNALVQLMAPPWFTFIPATGKGVAAPRLRADYWFPAPGHPASDTIRPAPGHVNLICSGALPSDNAYTENGEISAEQAHVIKDLMARYGSAGLTVTLVRIAKGYTHFKFAGAGIQNDWHAYATPTEEAQRWRWYAQTYEGLPVTVAVQVQPDTWLPDGRRYTEGPTQFNAFWKRYPNLLSVPPTEDTTAYGMSFLARPAEQSNYCVVIDRDGTIAYEDEMKWGRKEYSYRSSSLSEEDVWAQAEGSIYRLFHRVPATHMNGQVDIGKTLGTSSPQARPSVVRSEQGTVQ